MGIPFGNLFSDAPLYWPSHFYYQKDKFFDFGIEIYKTSGFLQDIAWSKKCLEIWLSKGCLLKKQNHQFSKMNGIFDPLYPILNNLFFLNLILWEESKFICMKKAYFACR